MKGTVLNERYYIEAEIGRGGMGVVYRSRDTLLDRPVAIKLVATSALGHDGSSRLLQEARAAARLNHPNIVAVYDAGEDDLRSGIGSSAFVVMELVEGPTLRHYSPSDLDEIVDITQQICAGLETAHQQGVIHRDLKPDNVAITLTGTAKLMDFGLARMAGYTKLTQEGTLIGTLAYIAPELILGQAATPKSDLYALGVMVYETVAGRLPFDADSPVGLLTQHLHAPVVPPSAYNEQLSPEFDAIILRLLQKRPADRPQSASAVSEAFGNIGLGHTPGYGARDELLVLERLVRGRLVAREDELAQAQRIWELASSGQGQILFVTGEAGIGKTRFVSEIGTLAEVSSGTVLAAACYAEGAVPYMPIAELIRSGLAGEEELELPDGVLGDLLTIAPDLSLSYPDSPRSEGADPEIDRLRIYESVTTLFMALAKRKSLLLFVDDIHWADSGTLSILRHLSRRLRNQRLMVVATYREEELEDSGPFHVVLGDWLREGPASRIKLSRLSQAQTQELLSILFAEDIAPEIVKGIYLETEGNPFFIEEICKALVEGRKLYFEGGKWHRSDVSTMEIPQGIRSAIQRRFALLTPEQERTLFEAALLGRDFRYDMLKVVSQVTEEELIETLERAEKLQLIQDLRSSTRLVSSFNQESREFDLLRSPGFSFTHALIHSTLLSTRSTLRRQRHQRQVAISLAEAFPDRTSELATLLGRYFAEANDAQRAVPYLLQSGDAARRIFAFEEAAHAYEHAVLLLEEMQEFRVAASTLMKLGLVYYNSHNFDQARRTYSKAFELRQLSGKLSESIGDKLPEAPHALRLNLGSPISLDPSRVTDALSQIVTEQIYSVLIGIGAEGELIPDIAHSWQIFEEGRKYVFKLRNDVFWSDGEPLTAYDFEFGWKRTLDPAFGRQQALSLYDVRGAKDYNSGVTANSDSVGVSAVDSTTLEVELEAPTGYFLYLLNSSAAMPVPQHAVAQYGDAWSDDDNIVTSGPFLLKTWERDKYIRLAKNPAYHGSFGGNINQVTMRLEPDATALESLYRSDELDMLYMFTLPSDVHERMRQRYTSEYLIAPALYTAFINFDTRRPPFDDARIRQAFVLATDRGAVADIILKGFSIPATGGMVPPGMPGHVEGIARGYHPELARDLLAQAGYPDGNGFPEIQFVAPATGAFPFADEALLDQWHQTLGVKIKMERMAFGELLKEVRNRIPHIWRMVWTADYPDPDNFLRVGTWLADGGWQNQEYYQLVTMARSISDEGERLSMYRAAEEMLVEESPVLPLTYGRYQFLLKPWLKHFPIVGMHVTRWKDAILESHS